MQEMPWQLKMFNKSLKKKMKVETLKKHFGSLEGKKCLLVTCGDNNGAMNWHIQRAGGQWSWGEMEDHNVESIQSLLNDKVSVIDKDTQKFPWPDNQFDLSMTIDCHEHLKDPTPLNKELLRVTKPGGKVIVTVPNGNPNKLATRIKKAVGMSVEKYGHQRWGYDVPELEALLKGVSLSPVAHSSYSGFFTEMVELVINFAYVNILSKKGKVEVEEGQIAPTTKDQLKDVQKSYRIYSFIYPVLWIVAQMDKLFYFARGHAVVVEARKS